MAQHTPPSGKVPLPAIILAKTTFAQAAVFQQTLMRIVETVNNHHPNLYSCVYDPEVKYRFRWTVMSTDTSIFFEIRLSEENCLHIQLELIPDNIIVDYYLQSGISLEQNINTAIDLLKNTILTIRQNTAAAEPEPEKEQPEPQPPIMQSDYISFDPEEPEDEPVDFSFLEVDLGRMDLHFLEDPI